MPGSKSKEIVHDPQVIEEDKHFLFLFQLCGLSQAIPLSKTIRELASKKQWAKSKNKHQKAVYREYLQLRDQS